MKFHSVPVTQAVGHILGHNILGESGRRILRKGRVLSDVDISLLVDVGQSHIYIAELGAGDIDEDRAGLQIAEAVTGDHLTLSKATTGRVNVYAERLGVLAIDEDALLALNLLDGVALATQQNHAVVQPQEMVANLKIVPYALPSKIVGDALAIGQTNATLTLMPLDAQRVGLIVTGSAAAKDKTIKGFLRALKPRVERLDSTLEDHRFVPLQGPSVDNRAPTGDSIIEKLSSAITELNDSHDMLLLAGDTAIMDRYDIVPQAVDAAGGEIICFGAPVDPGNLFLLAYLDGKPVVGIPGCARNLKDNLVDLILPRLLAGERLRREDIARLGLGGLLKG